MRRRDAFFSTGQRTQQRILTPAWKRRRPCVTTMKLFSSYEGKRKTMSKMLHADPDRRCKPLDEWPADDRALWQAALIPGDLFADGGARAKHSEFSNRKAVYGYGRFLT